MFTIVFTFLGLMFFSFNSLAQTKIAPFLSEKITTAMNKNQPVRACVVLRDQVNMKELDQQLYAENASLQRRASTVIRALRKKAESSQPELLAVLGSQSEDKVLHYESYWIINAVIIEAIPSVLVEVSERKDVAYLDYDYPALPEKTVEEGPAPESMPNSAEPGLKVINAHRLWQLGFTGTGRLVMNIDGGVDGTHPALAARWRGNHVPPSQAWLGNGDFPVNCGNGHGTHTMGILTGHDPANEDTIGVAPDAEWIAAATFGGCGASSMQAFQWALDPDEDPNTIEDMPDVISNSWGFSPVGGCMINTWGNILTNTEAAGIAVVWGGGNQGPGPQTIIGPKNININEVSAWAAGNVDAHRATIPIRLRSSRGPSGCGGTGSLLIKPEVVAPGTGIRSSIPGGRYDFRSGGSMACPHTGGAIALLKQAFPNLTGHQIKLALYVTAKETPSDLSSHDDGEPVGENSGEDNTYGMGLIDVFAAYNYLQSVTSAPKPDAKTESFVLYSNFPNPFNASTTVRYDLRRTTNVSIKIYNILGKELPTLVDKKQTTGEKSVIWDGRDSHGNEMSSGVYIFRIQFDGDVASRKMVLLR